MPSHSPPVPVNVITGFLGVGKTTAVLDLLARHPEERWAVLVNEYGEVSIDAAILAGGGANVTVRDVAGGCVCCATAPYLPVALHLLLTEAQPTRLIVETTGLGHPGRLLDTLRGPAYHGRLDVRATLAFVAPDDVTDAKTLQNPIFLEQVEMADVLVLNKLDTANPESLATFHAWAQELYPPKLLIAATEHGRIDREWLDLGGRERLPLLNDRADRENGDVKPLEQPQPGRPVRYESPGGVRACGWRFHASDRFDETALLRIASAWDSPRWKGVFHTSDGHIVLNRVGGTLTSKPTHYTFDSRVEIFSEVMNWDDVESSFRSALMPSE
jgi:G3E family GTPase